MIHDSIRFKTFESLVSQVAAALKSAAEDNGRLSGALAKLEDENRKLKEEVKRLSFASLNQDRLRARLQKLGQKLERLG